MTGQIDGTNLSTILFKTIQESLASARYLNIRCYAGTKTRATINTVTDALSNTKQK